MAHQWKTFLGIIAFSIIYVPIDIPSLSLTTGTDANINQELKSHGIANTLSGLLGGSPNYICYSFPALYYKCHGGGVASSLVIASITLVLLFNGTEVVVVFLQAMAGALMLQLGLDLLKEAVLDTRAVLTCYIYVTVWLMVLTMSF